MLSEYESEFEFIKINRILFQRNLILGRDKELVILFEVQQEKRRCICL